MINQINETNQNNAVANVEITPVKKYVIALKMNDFAERGHCFECRIKGNQVTVFSDLDRFAPSELQTISIEQFEIEFKEMSEIDYRKYMNACRNGEDEIFEAVVKKYLI